VYGVPGKVTQPSSLGLNQLIKQGAKLVTSREDVIEELPTPVRSQLLPVEAANSEERAKLIRESLARQSARSTIFQGRTNRAICDDMVELSGLTSSKSWPPYLTWSSKAWYVSYLVSNS
jgi:predicted Rossmann fold nucleotide-binding protein DprA/Smf involved in DNA uptake